MPSLIRLEKLRKGKRNTPAAGCIFIAGMEVEADKEDLFNEVDERGRIPLLLKAPGGVVGAAFEDRAADHGDGRRTRRHSGAGELKYSAVHEIESADALASGAWADAVDQGPWPSAIRPYVKNRRRAPRKVIKPGS